MDGAIMATDAGRDVDDCIAWARTSKARVRLLDRYADHIVENPASAQFHERPCINGLALGLPMRLHEPPAAKHAATAEGPIRILHSPSHPEAKGTPHIVAAVERLKARGHRIELVLITGRPNREVLQELAQCEFVVDQLYSDSPMAGFAAEAATFAKPAIVAGYAGDVIRRYLPAEALPPTLYCTPDEVESAIERFVTNPDVRKEFGRRAQSFVRNRWAARAVAERYLRLLDRDGPPSEWCFDPAGITYIYGSGLPAARVHALIRAVIERGGEESLAVSDKPVLLETLRAAAAVRDDTTAAAGRAVAQTQGD
jgi:hypothetical protein